MRDSPSLPVSGYPFSTEWIGLNVDSKRTRFKLDQGVPGRPTAVMMQIRANSRHDAERTRNVVA